MFQTRASAKVFFNAIHTLRPVQKACLERIGFGGLLDLKIDGIPSKLGFYVVDKFNPERKYSFNYIRAIIIKLSVLQNMYVIYLYIHF